MVDHENGGSRSGDNCPGSTTRGRAKNEEPAGPAENIGKGPLNVQWGGISNEGKYGRTAEGRGDNRLLLNQ